MKMPKQLSEEEWNEVQSKAGTHHGDAVDGTSTDPADLKLQQYRDCLMLTQQMETAAITLEAHLQSVGMHEVAAKVRYTAHGLPDSIKGAIGLAAFRLKGTI